MSIRGTNFLLGVSILTGIVLCLSLAVMFRTPYWLLGIPVLSVGQFVLHCPRCGTSIAVARSRWDFGSNFPFQRRCSACGLDFSRHSYRERFSPEDVAWAVAAGSRPPPDSLASVTVTAPAGDQMTFETKLREVATLTDATFRLAEPDSPAFASLTDPMLVSGVGKPDPDGRYLIAFLPGPTGYQPDVRRRIDQIATSLREALADTPSIQVGPVVWGAAPLQ